jgi:hypothetical protein
MGLVADLKGSPGRPRTTLESGPKSLYYSIFLVLEACKKSGPTNKTTSH